MADFKPAERIDNKKMLREGHRLPASLSRSGTDRCPRRVFRTRHGDGTFEKCVMHDLTIVSFHARREALSSGELERRKA